MAARGVLLREGLPEVLENNFPTDTSEGQTRILVLDDLMKKATDNEGVLDIFTAKSDYKNITAIMLTLNLFFRGKHSVKISPNASCILLLVPERLRVLKCDSFFFLGSKSASADWSRNNKRDVASRRKLAPRRLGRVVERWTRYPKVPSSSPTPSSLKSKTMLCK